MQQANEAGKLPSRIRYHHHNGICGMLNIEQYCAHPLARQ